MSTSPRIPLHIQKLMQESEMKKSVGGEPALGQGLHSPAGAVAEWTSDMAFEAKQFAPGIVHDYRVDINRTSGNQIFRRFHNGQLDVDAAKAVVIEILDQARDNNYHIQPLTDLQQLILSVIFPSVFNFMDPVVAEKMRAAQMNLSPQECQLVAIKVVQHLAQIMNYVVSTSGTSA